MSIPEFKKEPQIKDKICDEAGANFLMLTING